MKTEIGILGFRDSESQRLLSDMNEAYKNYNFNSIDQLDYNYISKNINIALIWNPGIEVGLTNKILDDLSKDNIPTLIIFSSTMVDDVNLKLQNLEVCFIPFSKEEIYIRIERLIPKADPESNDLEEGLIDYKIMKINSQRYEVYLLDKKIDLTYKEYELLKFLASNPNRVYSRDSLLKSVWDYDYFGGTRTVDVHIRRLRSKIDNPTHNFIETQWNVGYKFVPPEK
ncbi:MAG: winged helix-turn-helix domain-containing protein [Dehalococcoidia bacterium]